MYLDCQARMVYLVLQAYPVQRENHRKVIVELLVYED